MSSRTQQTAGKGVGKEGTGKRHIGVRRDNLSGITNPAIVRLARRGGVARMSRQVYPEARNILKKWLTDVLDPTITLTLHANRKTVTLDDVIYGLDETGNKLYGAMKTQKKPKKKTTEENPAASAE
jgi:histone H4